MRKRVREWRNASRTAKIVEFRGEWGWEGTRLKLEDRDGIRNVYPKDQFELDMEWNLFRAAH
jgi:hypothetical protein